MKNNNKLIDLNEHLFKQLERLNEEKIPEEKLMLEIERSKAIGDIAKNVINNGRLILDSKKHFDELGIKVESQPEMLRLNGGSKDYDDNK